MPNIFENLMATLLGNKSNQDQTNNQGRPNESTPKKSNVVTLSKTEMAEKITNSNGPEVNSDNFNDEEWYNGHLSVRAGLLLLR